MSDKKQKLKLRWVEAEVLKPYFRNTKIHTEEQLHKMAKMIDRFYFDQPIVVTPDLVIIKGHGRYMASLMAKEKRLVPIIVRDDLTEAQVTAARISDNRMFDLGVSMPEIIQSEVVEFVGAGGLGAGEFFDFVSEDVSKPKKAAAAPTIKDLIAPAEESQIAEHEGGLAKGIVIDHGDDDEAVAEAAGLTEVKAPPKAMDGIRCPNCNQLHKG